MVKNKLWEESDPPSRLKLTMYPLLRKSFRPGNHTIIFLHMPKAAGMSLNAILKKQYGADRILEVDPKRPRKAYLDIVNMPVWVALKLRGISGHAIWEIHKWLPKPFVYMTVLRDPVERVLSFYSYVAASPSHHLYTKMMNDNMKLDDFLDWSESTFETSNLQTKLLSSSNPFYETYMPDAFERARRNLEKYFLVGLAEQFGKSLEMFSSVFDWMDPQITYENVTPNRVNRKDLPVHTIRKIEAFNKYDMELYEIGVRLFKEQLYDPRSASEQKIIR